MRLGNLLSQKGGIPETGRPVRFQLRVKHKDGSTVRHWAEALLLPVSEADRAGANAAAADFCAGADSGPELADEKVYRFLQKALRDPEAPAQLFVRNDEMEAFRAGVTRDQVDWLYGEYKALIKSEYPELITRDQEKKLGEEAEDFTTGGPPSS